MSATIDERIVEMKFDDDDFERGVKSAVKYLDKLKKQLDLESAAKGANNAFKMVNDAATHIDFESVGKAVDRLNYRFSTLGVVATTALQNITNTMIDLGENIVGGTLTTVFTKGWRRATNIDQAEFTLKGLGMDVKQAMEDADFAVTDTAYGLDEAAKAASQFAASGVALGDDMKDALLGVAGVAALTNSDFTTMAEVFTHVAGQGKLMTMQLNQISARGVNAAASLAQYFREGLATEEEMAFAMDAYNKTAGLLDFTTEAGIREATTKGLISFEIFSHAMTALYGEHAKEANKTYEGSFANLQAALGRIAQPWMTSFRHNAIDIYNALTPVVKIFKTISDQWITPHVESTIKNISQFIIDTIGEVKVFPEVIRNLRTIFYKPFKFVINTLVQIGKMAGKVFDFPGLKETAQFLETVGKKLRHVKITIKEALTGDVHFKWSDEIVDVFGGIFSVINMAITGVKAFFKLTAPLWKLIGQGLLKIVEGAGALGRFLQNLNEVVTAAYHGAEVLDKIASFDLIDWFKNLGSNSKDFFDKLNSGQGDFVKFKEAVANVHDTGLLATFTSLKEEIGLTGMVANGFLAILEKIVGFAGSIGTIISDLKNGLSIKDALNNTNWGSKLVSNVQMFKEAFKGVDFLTAPMETIKAKFSELISKMGSGGVIFSAIAIGMQKIGNGFKKVFSGIKDSGLFAKISEGLSKLWTSVKNFKFEGSGLQKFFEFLKGVGQKIVNGSITGFVTIAKGIKTVATFIGGAIAAAADALKGSDFFQTLKGMGDSAKETGITLMNLPEKMGNLKESLSGGTNGIKEFFQTTFKGWTASDWWHAIETGILAGLSASLIGFFTELKKTFSTISSTIAPIKKVLTGIGQFFKNLKEFNGSINGFEIKTDTRTKFEHFADALKTIAKSILIVAAAIALLAIIPKDKLNTGMQAVAMIAGLLGVLVAAIGAATKWMSGDDKRIDAMSKFILKMCTGMLLIGIAIAAMSKNNPVSIAAGAFVMYFLMNNIIRMFEQFSMILRGHADPKDQIRLLKLFDIWSKTIQKIAVSIAIMSVGLAIVAGKDFGSILSAGLVIEVFIATIFAIFRAIAVMSTKMTPEQINNTLKMFDTFANALRPIGTLFLAMSAALAIISRSMKVNGWETVWASFGMIELLMASVVGLAVLAGRQQGVYDNFDKMGKGMMMVALAMIPMSIAIALIGKMKPEQALLGFGTIILVLLAIGQMAELAKDNKNLLQMSVTILAVGGAMIMIAGAMKMISSVDQSAVIMGLTVLIVLTGALSALMSVCDQISSDKLLAVSTTIISLTGGILLMAAAMAVMDGLEHTWRSVLQMAIGIGALVAAIVILDKFTTSADLYGIAGSLAILSVAILSLSVAMAIIAQMDTGTAWRSFGVIGATLGALVATILVLHYTGAVVTVVLLAGAFTACAVAFSLAAGSIAGLMVGLGMLTIGIAMLLTVIGGAGDVLAAELVAFLTTLSAGIGVIGTTLVTSITLIIKNILQNLEILIPDVVDGIFKMIIAVLDMLIEYGPQIVDKVLTAITGMVFALAEALKGNGNIIAAFGDLGASLMSTFFTVLEGFFRKKAEESPFGGGFYTSLADGIAEATAEFEVASENGTKAAEKWMEEQEQQKEEIENQKGPETTSLLDGLGLDSEGLGSILTAGDLSSTLTSVFGNIKIGDLGSSNMAEQIQKMFPDNKMFNKLGEGGLEEYIKGIQKENPDLDMSGFASLLAKDLDVSDEAEEAGAKIGKKFGKKLKKSLTGSEEDTSDLMKKLTNHFGAGSDEIQRLINSGGWSMLQELGQKVADGTITAEDAIAQLARIMNTTTDEEISEAEKANEEIYDKYYERGKAATEGMAAGLDDETARTALNDSAYRMARDAAAGVTDTLSMGNWANPVASSIMETIGKMAVQGLVNGIKSESLRAQLYSASVTLGQTIENGTKSKDGLNESSPSKKMLRIGLYAGEGLTIGIRQSGKKLNKAARKVANEVVQSFKDAGLKPKKVRDVLAKFTDLTKKELKGLSFGGMSKKLGQELADITKHLKKAKTDKQIKKWTKELRTFTKELTKARAKALGVKGKNKAGKLYLWESSDDYKDLTEQLKDAQKERKDAFKKANKLADKDKNISKNDVKTLDTMKKRYKELEKKAKKAEKNNKKEAKGYDKSAKKLKKYIDLVKNANDSIKDTNKEIREGYKKFWKQYWKDFKTSAQQTFRSLMTGDMRKSFQLFAADLSKPVNILGVEARNAINILDEGASSAAESIQILTNSLEKLTDVLSSSFDTGISLLGEFKTEWYNGAELLEDMGDNIRGYEDWKQGLEDLAKRNNSEDLVKYIKQLGFSSETLSQLNAFNEMSEEQFETAVNYLDKQLQFEKEQYLENMDTQLSDYREWKENLETLSKNSLVSDKMLKDLKAMGIEGAKYVKMFVNMSTAELVRARNYYAEEAKYAIEDYFDSIEDQIDNYSKWKNNLDLLTKKYGSVLGEEFIKNVKNMGVDGADYVEALLSMDSSDAQRLSEKFNYVMGKETESIVDNMNDNLQAYADYYDDLEKLEKSGYSKKFVKYLKEMGIEAADTVAKFANSVDDKEMVKAANDLYSKQVKINAREYLAAMQDEETKYSEWIANLNKLENAGLNRGMIKELQEAGLESYDKVEAIVELMNQGKINEINKLYRAQKFENANSLLNSTRSNISDWQEYYQGVSKIMDKTYTQGIALDESIISKIKEMGVDGLEYIREILTMSKKDIKELNEYAEAERKITKDNLFIDLKEQKKKQTQFYNDLKTMADKGFSADLIKELMDQGYDAAGDIAGMYADMSKSEVAEINKYYVDAAGAWQKAQSAFNEAVENGVTNVAKNVRSEKELYTQAGKELGEALTGGVISGVKEVRDAVEKVVKDVIDIPSLGLSSSETQKTMYKAMVLMMGQWREIIVPDKQMLYDGKYTAVKGVEEIIMGTEEAATTGTKKSSNTIVGAIKDSVDPSKNGLTNELTSSFKSMGNSCVDGLAEALSSNKAKTKVRSSVTALVSVIPPQVRSILGIHSPSRVMYDIATYAVLGFANSFIDHAYIASEAVTTMIGQTIDQAQAMSDSANLDLGIQPIFDPDAAATGLAAIDEMINAKKLAVQSLSFDNVSDINALTTLNDSLNNLTTAITGMESYGERLTNIETLLGTYLPDAATDVYLDGDKISTHVENTIANNIVRRRAGW